MNEVAGFLWWIAIIGVLALVMAFIDGVLRNWRNGGGS